MNEQDLDVTLSTYTQVLLLPLLVLLSVCFTAFLFL
jgi:hypothetical protein